LGRYGDPATSIRVISAATGRPITSPRRLRAHPTSCSSCSATSASRRWHRGEGSSRHLTSTSCPGADSGTRTGIPRHSVHPHVSSLVTGRNHTTNEMACIAETTTGFPNSNGHIPFECATIDEVLGTEAGPLWMLGKWHLVAGRGSIDLLVSRPCRRWLTLYRTVWVSPSPRRAGCSCRLEAGGGAAHSVG
jgi:hypothetical protein